MKRLILAIGIFFFSMLAIAADTKDEKKPVPKPGNASEYSGGIILNLSDADIKDAVALGKTSKSDSIESKYRVFSTGQAKDNDSVTIQTPFCRVADYVSSKTGQNLEPDPQFIESIKKEETLQFIIVVHGEDIEFPKSTHVVLKNGGKVIQPIKIDGKEKAPDSTVLDDVPTVWYGVFRVYFDKKEIAPKAKYTLVIIDTVDSSEKPTELDFSKYK